MKYCDVSKVGLIVARGKFEIDIHSTNYIFDYNKTINMLEKNPTIIGVFASNSNDILQNGMLNIICKCDSVTEVEEIAKQLDDHAIPAEDCPELFMAYTSQMIGYTFCKFGYCFALTFPRMLIDYSDPSHVDYVSHIEDENLEFAIHVYKTMSLAEMVNVSFEDRALIQEFCENHVSSYFGKNKLDDYCFANATGIISKKLLSNVSDELNYIGDMLTRAGGNEKEFKRMNTVKILLKKYLE